MAGLERATAGTRGREAEGLSRRQLLGRGLALGGAAVLGTPAVGGIARRLAPTEPRVVIVGAGLAGLACADLLVRRGLQVSVYEARDDRVGGRCWTAREFAAGQSAEHGGEFIDSRHRRMRGLAHRFGLRIDDLYAAYEGGTNRVWLKGELRDRDQFEQQRRLFQRRIEREAQRVGSYSYDDATRAAREFDEMTVKEWLDANLSRGGSASLQGRLVWALAASEFGLDADRLSALNLFYQYTEKIKGADERFHIRGGNDQIPRALAGELPRGTVQLGAPLRALHARADGSFGLRFVGIGREVHADHVVLCTPLTTLREVDLDHAGLSSRKRACIDELGMGNNAKLLLQFERRPAAYGNWNGYLVSDSPYYLTWESSLAQGGRPGLLTVYFGGRSGGAVLESDRAHRPAPPRTVDRILRTLGRGGQARLPGMRGDFNGRAWLDHWAADPWARGSYAAFLPGQFTRYYGFVGRREGRIHFGGEHTATNNQGFLEGAVKSGERCAREVLRGAR